MINYYFTDTSFDNILESFYTDSVSSNLNVTATADHPEITNDDERNENVLYAGS